MDFLFQQTDQIQEQIEKQATKWVNSLLGIFDY